ncbi:hypothetical protein INT45_008427 [Circinella minor]|uniref:Uncharacterized protein n=1 Tax=Circinella minor TaxID=1195481 RepID=A0A8H7VSI7_9FUNG|nr:hypothetical protein INT45_008427 [Circinella minor]
MEIATTITRSQAACIFYGESINTENKLKCERWLADLTSLVFINQQHQSMS